MATGGPNLSLLWGAARRLAELRGRFDSAWQVIRDAGLPTDRATFLEVWRLANEARYPVRRLEGRSDRYVPTAETIIDSPLTFSRRYAYRVAVHGLLPGTEEEVTRHVTVLSSRRIALGDAVTDAIASIFTDPDLYNIDATGAEVVAVERSA